MGMIHQTAVIDKNAEIDPTARIGPYTVIDAGVRIGAGCLIGPHVYITGRTTLGSGNQIHAGCVLGDAPQDVKYKDAQTELRVGDENIIREHVTIHRSNSPTEPTVIGSGNFLMHHCHVGHNSRVGNNVIIVSGALLAGHVDVADRALISGNCLIHQFVRIGTLAMMQGGAAITKDLPPFCVARGYSGICGLNTVGLRRAGIGAQDRQELKRLYHALFRSRGGFTAALAAADAATTSVAGRQLIDFLQSGKRGFCADTGSRGQIPLEDDEQHGA